MDVRKELKERTAQAEAVVERYLPEESGHQKTIFQAMNYSNCRASACAPC